MAKVRRYRCGWCGHPTDGKGKPVQFIRATVEEDYRDAKHVNGLCCPGGDNDNGSAMYQVTHEMAMDAGDPSLEGTWTNW